MYPSMSDERQPDLLLFSEQNLRAQCEHAEEKLGYKLVEFYVDAQGLPSKKPTETSAQFYFLQQGGALRDAELNVIQYVARLDEYRELSKKKRK